MTKEEKKKAQEYAKKLHDKIGELFSEDDENFIDISEFDNDNYNMTLFFHALMNLMPGTIFYNFTGEAKSTLDLNHMANRLCCQYIELIDPDKEDE